MSSRMSPLPASPPPAIDHPNMTRYTPRPPLACVPRHTLTLMVLLTASSSAFNSQQVETVVVAFSFAESTFIISCSRRMLDEPELG